MKEFLDMLGRAWLRYILSQRELFGKGFLSAVGQDIFGKALITAAVS